MTSWKFIGDRIRSLCLQKKISLRELAGATNISLSTLYKITDNEQIPKLTTVKKICDGFGISLSEFFHATEESEDINLSRSNTIP